MKIQYEYSDAMKNLLRSFYLALSFLTRIPVPLKGDISQQEIAQSMLFYPAVGLLIGIILWLIIHILLFVSSAFPPGVIAAIELTVWVLLTGGLHLDGLADSADAWIGGQNNRIRTLEIMKDPYCGPIGVTIIMLLLLIKWSSLSFLLKTGHSAFILVIPMLSRSMILVLFMSTEYVRENGLGAVFMEELPDDKALWTVLIVALLLSLILTGWWSIILMSGVIYGLRILMIKRLGGMTGDTIGASVEIAEAAALIGLLF